MLYVALIGFLLATTVHADPLWRIELHTGSAYNFDTTLKIDQPQGTDYDFSAEYETRPFTGGPYYSVRISRWNKQRGWEIEFLHHKIYLDNTPPGVRSFRISNGYNMLLVNHGWEIASGIVLRAGAGPVIAFPISNIEDALTDGGYQLAGLAFQTSLEKRFDLSQRFSVSLEGKLTGGRAKVDLNGGSEATAPNVALHALAGFGFNL